MIKSFVVGVSEYDNPRYNIPLCYNDIQAIKEAMVLGLTVKPENIYSIGENKIVKLEDFKSLLCKTLKKIEKSDTFIFYFSGHGSNEKMKTILFSAMQRYLLKN